jgi:hypothetical protein
LRNVVPDRPWESARSAAHRGTSPGILLGIFLRPAIASTRPAPPLTRTSPGWFCWSVLVACTPMISLGPIKKRLPVRDAIRDEPDHVTDRQAPRGLVWRYTCRKLLFLRRPASNYPGGAIGPCQAVLFVGPCGPLRAWITGSEACPDSMVARTGPGHRAIRHAPRPQVTPRRHPCAQQPADQQLHPRDNRDRGNDLTLFIDNEDGRAAFKRRNTTNHSDYCIFANTSWATPRPVQSEGGIIPQTRLIQMPPTARFHPGG